MSGQDELESRIHPAHVLWVELSTRIASRSLHFRSGEEETAVDSIFKLFGTTRELLVKHPEAEEFQEISLRLLNDVLRPNLARWHGWMSAGQEMTPTGPRLRFRDPWVRRQFRRELRALQPRLVGFRNAFEALKNFGTPKPWWTDPDSKQLEELKGQCRPAETANLGKDLPAGISGQVRFGKLPDDERLELLRKINSAEQAEIRRKRGETGGGPIMNATALAFSGGGIRSATFCLGISQVLARRKLFKEFDYMSTVSGGGYFGSFLSAYLGSGDWETRQTPKPNESPTSGELERETDKRLETLFGLKPEPRPDEPPAEPAELHPEPRAIRHLRNHSRFLADGSFSRKLAGFGIVALGVLFNLLIILPVPLFAALLALALYHLGLFGFTDWNHSSRWFPPAGSFAGVVLWAGLIVTAGLAFVYPVVKNRSSRSRSEDGEPVGLTWWEVAFVAVASLDAVALLVWLQPACFRLYHLLRTAPGWVGLPSFDGNLENLVGAIGASIPVVVGLLASRRRGAGGGRWLGKLVILSGPLLYLFIYFFTGYRLMLAASGHWHWWVVLAVAVLLSLWALLFVDVNTYSPHGYYRDRLSECYLRARKSAPEAPMGHVLEQVDGLRLSGLNQTAAAPYHLINTTVNLPNSGDREMRGRDADFYLFSKHWCGSPLCGYFKTTELEESDPHLDLGTAMAISGAAVSSNMGWQTNNSLRLLLTVANVRLGYWLPNPFLTKKGCKPKPGPFYLLREMFARKMDEHQKFLNLSDGGHHENLAVYELLRRRCKFIVCVDGGMEPDMQCVDLIRLERYASIDLGIRMHYDLADLMLQPNGYGRAYGILVKIDYNPPKDESERRARKPEDCEWGWMLFIKLAMVGYGPGYVMDYKRTNPAFPHQTTNDQIYDEAQFEAYRALGEAAAESFFSSELFDDQPEKLEEWFGKLAGSLLPDNDEAIRLADEVDQTVMKAAKAIDGSGQPPQ